MINFEGRGAASSLKTINLKGVPVVTNAAKRRLNREYFPKGWPNWLQPSKQEEYRYNMTKTS